ncbi:hypothetical protein DFH08DRAFT_953484 [Mycena albidolilacea]|uniref:F-box domain-containing protein n=1 Tax=Mycena albidolilacea TaxID=1033008 RepID=A0AAD7AGY8_9AGAR|nr:hypothetical protein DFH08DRAFT_953484 [Mycena albidolilacea]
MSYVLSKSFEDIAQPGRCSESTPSSHPSRHDPTVHLPAELLVEVFDMCSPPGEDGFDGLSETTTPAQEVERLAKQYLLKLSQVCSRWHVLVMGTPLLWRIIIVDTTLWRESNISPTTLISLVATSLERGASHPLTLQVAVEDDESYSSEVLELLSRHAERWWHAHFWSGFSTLQSIATARGNLPLLEDLEISQNDDWMEFNVFEIAPRLTHVTVTGWATPVPNMPWAQIQLFRYQNFEPNDLSLAILGNDFSPHATFDLTLDVADIDSSAIDLPPVVSNVSGFLLSLTINDPTTEVLGAVVGCLTLPHLATLALVGKSGTVHSLPWSQRRFLAFAARSSLESTLTSLEIARTAIDDDELLACLAVLPLLEHLFIADSEDAPHSLVTDALLRRLSLISTSGPPPSLLPPQPALVPRLNFVSLTSLLDFSDDVYWAFVASRLVPARWAGLLLEAKIYYLPECYRELSEEFISKGLDLEEQGEMNFTVRSNPEEA